MRHVNLGFFSVLVFLLSCTSATLIPSSAGTYPPRRTSEEIEVLMSDPKADFIELGWLDIEGAALSSRSAALNKAKKKAAAIGGDAIIIRDVGKQYLGYATHKTMKAVVIRYQ